MVQLPCTLNLVLTMRYIYNLRTNTFYKVNWMVRGYEKLHCGDLCLILSFYIPLHVPTGDYIACGSHH